MVAHQGEAVDLTIATFMSLWVIQAWETLHSTVPPLRGGSAHWHFQGSGKSCGRETFFFFTFLIPEFSKSV